MVWREDVESQRPRVWLPGLANIFQKLVTQDAVELRVLQAWSAVRPTHVVREAFELRVFVERVAEHTNDPLRGLVHYSTHACNVETDCGTLGIALAPKPEIAR